MSKCRAYSHNYANAGDVFARLESRQVARVGIVHVVVAARNGEVGVMSTGTWGGVGRGVCRGYASAHRKRVRQPTNDRPDTLFCFFVGTISPRSLHPSVP